MPLSPLGGTLDTAPAFATPTFDITPRPLSSVSPPNLATGSVFAAGDRVKDGVSALTSSLVTLAKANPTGFNNFKDGVGDGNYCFYCLADSSGNWEAQYGQYNDAAGTLTRSPAPLASNTTPGDQVSFSGIVTVFGNWPAAAETAMNWGIQTGRMYVNAFVGPTGGVNGSGLTSGIVHYVPIWITRPFSSAAIHFNIASAGAGAATVDVGLYNNVNGAPYAQLGQQVGLNVGTGATTGDNASSSISMPQPQPAGLYWAALVQNGAKPNIFVAQVSVIGNDLFGSASIADNTLRYGWKKSGQFLPLIAGPASAMSIGANGGLPFMGVQVNF